MSGDWKKSKRKKTMRDWEIERLREREENKPSKQEAQEMHTWRQISSISAIQDDYVDRWGCRRRRRRRSTFLVVNKNKRSIVLRRFDVIKNCRRLGSSTPRYQSMAAGLTFDRRPPVTESPSIWSIDYFSIGAELLIHTSWTSHVLIGQVNKLR